MMHAILTVFRKEVLENLRDRRVIFSAFFFGVLLAPAMFAVTATMVSNRAVRDQERPLQLPIAGSAQAPNLLRFLRENGVEVEAVDYNAEQAIEAVRANRHEYVLVVPPKYGEQLKTGEPAALDLVVDTSNSQATGPTSRARKLLESYGRQLASLRLLVRGVSPAVIQPVDVRMVDIATPAGRSLLILGMLTYFCLTSMLVGGFYLAIDTTAGERERGSLESLLALPVSRGSLILGKIMATAAFMAVSLLLTLAAFSVALSLVPLEGLGMSANFGAGVVLAIFGVMAAFLPLGAGLLTVVASFTRSNREAQTWLSVVLLIPIAPIMFAVVSGTKPTPLLMAIPSLSQHLLATQLLRGDPIDPLHVAISASTTLAIGAALILGAVGLYRRDAILG
jgi:sodium transport system permease protein